MEDCKVSYDMTVRNANGNIIQFLYGEDGIDAIKIENQPLHYVSMSPEKMEQEYLITSQDDLSVVLSPETIRQLKQMAGWQERVFQHFMQLHEDREFFIKKMFGGEQETSVLYPVSFTRIINNVHSLCKTFNVDGVMSDLTPGFVLDEIDKLCAEVFVSRIDKGTKLFEMLARLYLSPKQMIFKYGFDTAAFKQVVQQVKLRFFDSIVHPSEMVGVVAAQSIGEPLSQTTLNTFHLSGVSSASKAVRGVPRIEELTRVTKNVKAPSIVIFLRDEFSKSKEKSMEIKNKIETTTFRDIFKCSKIYFDPEDNTTSIENDDRIVELYKEYQLLDEDCDRSVSPWLLRLELDRSKMLDRGLTMIDLHHALLNHFGNRVKCMFSDDNAANLIFRIKLYEDVSESANDMLTDLKAMESTILENVILKGIEKLNKVEILKRERLAYDDGSRTFQKTHEWCLDTDGTNLVEVLGLPYVDATRTVSNDVNEVYQIFGIEAARQCLYNEIYSVIKDAEAHVNFRHLSLLVDTMTSKGALMSIDRHGINKGDIGPLAKCSFEEVNDVLVKAGVFSELDRVNGVSANIMLGQIAPCGTGDTEILIDESKLRDSISKSADLPRPAWELDDMDLAKEESCLADNFRLDFAVPEIDPSIQKKKV
jgi:DNA-directed RNA polymerase II subunit RPB1